MTITILTVASTLPADMEVELVASTDGPDQTFTWAANPSTGVTFTPNPSQRIPGQSTTVTRVKGGNGTSTAIAVTGDVSSASSPHTVAFVSYNASNKEPIISLVSDAIIVEPGNSNDASHSPLYQFSLQVWDQNSGAYVGVAGAEVRWTVSPDVAGGFYQGGSPLMPVTTTSTYIASKTDGTGKSGIRVTASQIVCMTVQATTLGVYSFKNEKAYYATLDDTSSYYQNVDSLGAGPYTDNTVDLTGTSQFGITVPSNLVPPPNLTFDELQGFIQLDGNGTHLAQQWDDMAPAGDGALPVLGRIWLTPNAELNQNSTNKIGLFVQDGNGNVFTYYPFTFDTEGVYKNEPSSLVSRNVKWLPSVVGVNQGGTINKPFVSRNGGIPVAFTADFGAPYNDGTWYIYFEWFLNNYDLTKTDSRKSPQSASISSLKVVTGSKTYTDTLSSQLSSGYSGPGTLYVDFYLGKNPDVPASRVYSDWSRLGWTLST